MKKLTGLVVFIVLVSFIAGPVYAKGKKGKSGQAGKSNRAHLYLYEKDNTSWEIVEGGGWGKMHYNLAGSSFELVFNGHMLPIGQDYTLIYYPDPWPGDGLICIGDGTVNDDGNIHIKGEADTGDLPFESDENHPDGAKIWLVLSADVDCDGAFMSGWNGPAYLFEYDLISFDDTDE